MVKRENRPGPQKEKAASAPPPSLEGALPPLTPKVEMGLYQTFPASELALLTDEQRRLLGNVFALYQGRRQDLKVDVPPALVEPLREVFRILGVEAPSQLKHALLGPNRHGMAYLKQLRDKGLEPPFEVQLYAPNGIRAEVTAFSSRAGTFTVRLLDGSNQHSVVNPTNCYIDGSPVCEAIPASFFRGAGPASATGATSQGAAKKRS